MPSAEPTRLTDDLWLAAHDSLRGTSEIGDQALGVGLATGLVFGLQAATTATAQPVGA